jgi:hypothetical protein
MGSPDTRLLTHKYITYSYISLEKCRIIYKVGYREELKRKKKEKGGGQALLLFLPKRHFLA